MKIKDMDMNLRPREKALRFGLRSLSDAELLSLLLTSGSQNKNVLALAQEVVEKTDGLRSLPKMEASDLLKIEGIGQAKALMIVSAMELARRASQARACSAPVHDASDVEEWLKLEYGSLQQENFAALYLDSRGHILHHQTLFVGTLNQSLVHPREIFKQAFVHSASSVLFVHNHPSGDLVPSVQDLSTTRQLVETSKVCQIPIMDHLIVSSQGTFSFKEHGLLDEEGEVQEQ